jgi:hypothetical protein
LNQLPDHKLALGISSVIASRSFALLFAAASASIVLQPVRVQAQWWRIAPADFEECADAAEKLPAKEVKAALANCNAKFAGRRKPGGGYTYFDFMQNRSFDIAGPNPTPEEQKHIDQQYTVYLDAQRRIRIAEANASQQQQQQKQEAAAQQQALQPVTFKKVGERVPLPVQAPNKQRVAAGDLKLRGKTAHCAPHSFSCEWPKLSESLNELKKLFGSSQGKDNTPSAKDKRADSK